MTKTATYTIAELEEIKAKLAACRLRAFNAEDACKRDLAANARARAQELQRVLDQAGPPVDAPASARPARVRKDKRSHLERVTSINGKPRGRYRMVEDGEDGRRNHHR